MSDMLEIRVPAEHSEGTRSQVLRWLKAEGDSVAENEPLIEMETDKVTVEIASPGAGVLRQILKPEQTEVEPGDVLGLIEAEVHASETSAPGTPDASARSKDVATPADTANSAVQQQPKAVERGESGARAAGPEPSSEASGAAARALSPAVKRLLGEHGLEASLLKGTGQGGRITVDDVLAHISKTPASAQSFSTAHHADRAKDAVAVAKAARVAEADSAASGVRRVPHSAVRKRVAEHMVRSLLHTAPHVTSVFEADLTAVLTHRAKHKEQFEKSGTPLTLTAYFLVATVAAIRAAPEANSRWTDDALAIHENINIGVATALGDQGLVVPVMRHVEALKLPQIATELQRLVSRARDGKLSPEDVRDGTFTISNHGVSGSLLATPIVINQPQSAILGIGKLEKRITAISDNGADRFVVAPKCYVTLTIDHRVMDGFQANKFLQTFIGRLEAFSTETDG